MVQAPGFIRGINQKSKIQNSQESGSIRWTARGGGDAMRATRASSIQNPKSKIQNRMTHRNV
jgi:hypothetical protein